MFKKGILFVFAVIFLMATIASATAAGRIPFGADTELYYESRLAGLDFENVYADFYDKISKIEIFEPYLAKVTNRLQIDPKKDIFSWMGGRIRFGIVSPDGKPVIHNAIKDYSSYAKARTQLRETVSKLRQVRTAVEIHLNEKEKLPSSIRDLGPDITGTLKLPRGGQISYKKINETEYMLFVPKGQFTELGIGDNNPSYHSIKGFIGNVPKKKKKFHLKNFLLAVDVKNTDACRSFFTRLEGILNKDEAGKGISFKKIAAGTAIIKESKLFSYTFRDQLVLISDRKEVLEHALKIMDKPEKSLSNCKVYKDYLTSLPKTPGLNESLFINLQLVNLTPKMLNVTNKNMAQFIESLYYAGYTASMDKNLAEGSFELGFKPDNKDSILDKYFKRKTFYEEKIMENLPSGIPMAMVYNLGEIWEMTKVIGTYEKSLGDSLKLIQSRFGMVTSLDLDADLIKPADGQIAMTYKLRDLLLSGLIKDFDKNEAVSQLRGKRMLQSMFNISKMPMTFFVQMDSPEKAKKLIDLFRKAKGDLPEYVHNGTQIYMSDKMALCACDKMVMIHTFPSNTVLKEYIDRLTLQRKRLGETTNYREFKKGIVGRILLIQYQDSRWAASLTKGLLLLFLPEFEDYAERAGNFKESWSAVSIHPRGLRIYFKMFN